MVLPRVSTLAQVTRLAPPLVLLIGDSTHAAEEAVLTDVTTGAKLAAYFVHMPTADQALLDRFFVTSLPLLVFLKARWCAMVLGVHRHEVESMCAWVAAEKQHV